RSHRCTGSRAPDPRSRRLQLPPSPPTGRLGGFSFSPLRFLCGRLLLARSGSFFNRSRVHTLLLIRLVAPLIYFGHLILLGVVWAPPGLCAGNAADATAEFPALSEASVGSSPDRWVGLRQA